MGKLVGLAGALTAFGAVAYLMTPVPQDEASRAASVRAGPATAASTTPTAHHASAPAQAAAARRVASAPQPTRESGATLVHQIQSELQRLGCYSGSIDGRWSEATQRAMQSLGERVSVLRPVDTPDYIMLALARGQQGEICGGRQQRSAEMRPTSGVITAPARAQRPEAAPALRTSPPSRTVAPEPRRATSAVARRAPEEVLQPRVAAPVDPAEAARVAAAREELARLDARRRAAPREIARPAEFEESQATADPPTLERSRMGLGVATVDPLRAGIDPRDPNAPAILRGPPSAPPITTARVGAPVVAIDAIAPQPLPRRSPLAASELPATSMVKQKRRVWQRAIFNDMQRNGP